MDKKVLYPFDSETCKILQNMHLVELFLLLIFRHTVCTLFAIFNVNQNYGDILNLMQLKAVKKSQGVQLLLELTR